MTNGVGPIIAYKYFRSLLEQGNTKMIVNFASNYGSMTLASEPLRNPKKATPLDHTQIAYKASKAAVNMGTICHMSLVSLAHGDIDMAVLYDPLACSCLSLAKLHCTCQIANVKMTPTLCHASGVHKCC